MAAHAPSAFKQTAPWALMPYVIYAACHIIYVCCSYVELLCTRPRRPLEMEHARPTLSLPTLIADRPVHYPLFPPLVLSIKLLKLKFHCIFCGLFSRLVISPVLRLDRLSCLPLSPPPTGAGPLNWVHPQLPIFHLPGGWIAVHNTGYFSC